MFLWQYIVFLIYFHAYFSVGILWENMSIKKNKKNRITQTEYVTVLDKKYEPFLNSKAVFTEPEHTVREVLQI